MAFACRPSLIVLDEPTTGLDVSTQRHVLETVRSLCRSYGVAAVYVSHDLAVVSGLVSGVAVMYAGRIVEIGSTARLFGEPVHPYTRGLIGAVPSPDRAEALVGIEGQQPRPGRRGPGCSFAPRCGYAIGDCTTATLEPVIVDRSFRALPACLGTPGHPSRTRGGSGAALADRGEHAGHVGPGSNSQVREHASAACRRLRGTVTRLRGRSRRVWFRQDHPCPLHGGAAQQLDWRDRLPRQPPRPRSPPARQGSAPAGSSTSSRIPTPRSTRARPLARSSTSSSSSSPASPAQTAQRASSASSRTCR